MIELLTGMLLGIPIGGLIAVLIIWFRVKDYLVLDMSRKKEVIRVSKLD